MDKRFNVMITAVVTEVTPNGPEPAKPFADDTVQYHDLGYQDLVRLEGVWAKLHSMLVALGEENIEAATAGQSGKVPPGQAKKYR